MKRKTEKDKPESESSRRGFIRKAAVGLTAVVVGGTTPIAKALQGRDGVEAERRLIECTIGQATRMMMDGSSRSAPDMAKLYRGNGGSNQFSIDLLTQTFGESSGLLRPGAPPNFDRIASALAAKAKALGKASGKATVTPLRAGAATPANSVFRINAGKPSAGGGGPVVETGDITINC